MPVLQEVIDFEYDGHNEVTEFVFLNLMNIDIKLCLTIFGSQLRKFSESDSA